MAISNYPLCWPQGWRRMPDWQRKNGQFNKKEPIYRDGQRLYNAARNLSIKDGLDRVLGELERLGVDRQDIIVSTNVRTRLDGLPRSGEREPADPGAAVYWREKADAPMRCMAIDRYNTVADNLAAVGATLDAMRAIERHGGAEILDRAFTGFTALSAAASDSWWEVLSISPDASVEEINRAHRELARKAHPDVAGGSEAWMSKVNAARDAALNERGV